MPVVKLRPSGTPDAMKSEGNDSLDTFIKQAIGKEPPLSFSRTGDNPVQWIQLLHALDQQDLPGWPLLSPLKIQMQKCEKCSREFCSPINYRRHSRVHRSLNVNKESDKYRDLLGAFWDKLSLDEVKEIVSLKDVTLEEVPGSSVIQALTSFIRKPGFCALPQLYVKAGSALLVCFDGEAGKIGLEMKNLVACTSFLIEQKLVRAWFADKDAEALRCQKLLVEEEEAAQKRSAQVINGNKIWTRKPKSENDGENLKSRLQKEAVNQADQNCEVMIGSISVTLGSCTAQQPSDSLGEHAMSKYSGDEKTVKSDTVQGVSNRSVVKLWRPVSRHETRGPMPVQSDGGESRGHNNTKRQLSNRWKEAIAADHVKLVLAPESEPPGCPDTENDYQVVIPSSDDHGRHVLGNAENLLDSTVALESMTTGTVKAKFRTKPEKGVKIKYIPKQKRLTEGK
ncbi:hypothetical protein LOK49_LG07G00376 [Camellia lanceoleosa]|uniref:Uncharacterized protein n=1 Tax=Camellia lanceoleosa TaxID=1840588 RepID=A0ACC0H296_9ERIC|nr:hypothetical protein LOK49_LG07G00376 [Camellia lanceoleosa]